jgi:hypothetical protein
LVADVDRKLFGRPEAATDDALVSIASPRGRRRAMNFARASA